MFIPRVKPRVYTNHSHSKEDFEKAIGEQGKYVLILAYNGSVHPKAEECVYP